MEFTLSETRQGIPVLMLSGSYPIPVASRPVQGALSGAYRMVSTCMRGYVDIP